MGIKRRPPAVQHGGVLYHTIVGHLRRCLSTYLLAHSNRPNMGYLRLTVGLMFCSCGFPLTLSCPYPVGLFLVPTLWEALPSSTVGDRY